MQHSDLHLHYADGLWLGTVSSRFGVIEVLFGGTAQQPAESEVTAFRRFAVALDENIAKLRNRVPFAFLCHPIRIAINNEKKVGVQFRNWLTGSQSAMILEEAKPPGDSAA
jgi:hypothetical protein